MSNQPSSAGLPEDFVPGNYFDKYRSNNPIHRAMLNRFLTDVSALVGQVRPRRILEVGCGSGDLVARLLGSARPGGVDAPEYIGTDVSPEEIEQARVLYPGRAFRQASIYELPFEDRAFDLVLACEVFEHLEQPERGLAEVERVCSGHLVVSVPWEPVWCLFNLVRGKYLTRLGNTPGHVQNFSRARFRRLVASRFELLEERRPIPWTVLLGRRPGAGMAG